MTGSFKDHFSAQSVAYAKHRPTYPVELFQFLAAVASGNTSAWDCATGSGQVAVALSDYFSRVFASDASQSQIAAAIRHAGVEYQVATAEQSGLDDNSVDLITVGQAFHWFDEALFMAEAHRVLRPDGVLAIWCYELCKVSDECDAVIDTLYRGILENYWPPERITVEHGYSNVVMPGAPLTAPALDMSLTWHATDMLGYLRTWSACKRYEAENGSDPVVQVEAALTRAWGDGERLVTWPLAIKVSRPNTLLD